MSTKKLRVPFGAALHCEDTETQTYGCRANNPDICGNNGLLGVCAFTREDCICKKPSRVWKKQFAKLADATKHNDNG